MNASAMHTTAPSGLPLPDAYAGLAAVLAQTEAERDAALDRAARCAADAHLAREVVDELRRHVAELRACTTSLAAENAAMRASIIGGLVVYVPGLMAGKN